jgi:hypothetical protein
MAAGTFPADSCTAAEGASQWQAGFAKVVITPDEPMWMSGYAGRTAPSDGKIHDLFARAAALRDPAGKTVVMVSTDLIGVPAGMAQLVSQAVEQQHAIPRANLMLTCSHTHCGPALDDRLTHILFLSADEAAKVVRYQQQLNAKLIDVISRAIADLQPARLATGIGKAEFAANRRPPIGLGPIDHEVPVLRALTADGQKLRGVIFGYACHNTTLGFQKFCGDYAGFAALYLEDHHPDATALFFTGCGADQNPLPRRSVELAEKYGRMLALAVEQVLAAPLSPLQGRVVADFQRIDLPFAKVPTREELEQRLKTGNKYEQALAQRLLKQLAETGALEKSYPYPIQVWKLGNQLTWVALGGEVTVEYSLRLKSELGPGRTWVTGYANDVMAYIPSEKVLTEGGYEGESSMIYYQIPSKWAPGIEDRIVKAVHDIATKLGQ